MCLVESATDAEARGRSDPTRYLTPRHLGLASGRDIVLNADRVIPASGGETAVSGLTSFDASRYRWVQVLVRVGSQQHFISGWMKASDLSQNIPITVGTENAYAVANNRRIYRINVLTGQSEIVSGNTLPNLSWQAKNSKHLSLIHI